jgi:imidazoleglycerol-phosphate dehydratase
MTMEKDKKTAKASVAAAPPRRAYLRRKTRETDVSLGLELDGRGNAEVATGIGFLDHMLTALATHGRLDLKVECRGDLRVDAHHSIEDVAIVLGDALHQALGDRRGIARFGHAYVPLDEALARCVIDLSGRPYLHCDVRFDAPQVGVMPTEMFEDFFRALANHARMTLHLDLIRGRNSHHVAEALFKALARALAMAVAVDPRQGGIPSTKGSL